MSKSWTWGIVNCTKWCKRNDNDGSMLFLQSCVTMEFMNRIEVVPKIVNYVKILLPIVFRRMHLNIC